MDNTPLKLFILDVFIEYDFDDDFEYHFSM